MDLPEGWHMGWLDASRQSLGVAADLIRRDMLRFVSGILDTTEIAFTTEQRILTRYVVVRERNGDTELVHFKPKGDLPPRAATCLGDSRHHRLVRVTTPAWQRQPFCCGLIFSGPWCIEAAPIMRWATGKQWATIEHTCKRMRWRTEVVKVDP